MKGLKIYRRKPSKPQDNELSQWTLEPDKNGSNRCRGLPASCSASLYTFCESRYLFAISELVRASGVG